MANATLYLGAVACGKTTLIKSHLESIRRESVREADPPLIFVYDHTGEWDLTGSRVYTTTDEWWREPALCSVFRGGSGPRDVAQLAIDTGWSLYIDDEVDQICHDGKWIGNPLREIIRRGRHIPNRAGVMCEVGALVATQRPAGIPGDLTGLFERVYVGRLTSAADVERVRREGWITGADSFADVAAALRERQTGEFSVWPES